MALSYHPDIATGIAGLAGSPLRPASVPRGDWKALRATTEAAFEALADAPLPATVHWSDHSAVSTDGVPLRLRWIHREAGEVGPAFVYIHGGGMIMCDIDQYLPVLAPMVEATGVPILAVDFRNAPEVPAEQLAEDALTGVEWLIANAGTLGVDPTRIAIGGDSGGGGIAAGAAILARDRGVPLARQILICPMLDDRNVEPDPHLAPLATWSYDNNYTAWTAVLGDRRGGKAVPASVAPARLTDFEGLPPAYIEVGEVDIFRDEDMRYAQGLLSAGVHVDFILIPGAPHGFEGLAPGAALVRQHLERRLGRVDQEVQAQDRRVSMV